MTGRPCHFERVGGVPVLVSGELTPEDRAEVADFAALLRELGTAQTAPEPGSVLLHQNMALRAARRVGEPCDQCTGHDRQHTDDCPEAAL